MANESNDNDDDELCVFCKKRLDSDLNVQITDKGLKRIRECSIKRDDGLLPNLNKTLTVHIKCRKSYISEDMIKAFIKRKLLSNQERQSESSIFNFELNRLKCGAEDGETSSGGIRRVKKCHTKASIQEIWLRRKDISGETISNHPEASTSNSGAGNARDHIISEERSLTLLNLDSDDETTEQDAGDSDQAVQYTRSKETQKGRLWLSSGAGNAGSLLPETPAHSLQQELLMDLHEISDKIQNFYPNALGKQFTLTFKGEDGDRSEYVFTSASDTRRSGEAHSDLSCDECGSDIIGFRYKCVSCADYDLCLACEALGTHADHLMMRIAKPIKLKQAQSLLQRWCKAMKTAGVTTIEEITGSPDSTARNSSPAVAVGPTNTRPKIVKERTPKSKSLKKECTRPPTKSVDAKKGKIEVEIPGENWMKIEKIETAEANRMKKRKIETPEEDNRAKIKYIEKSAGDTTSGMPNPIKEEPLEDTILEDFYSSFAETEPTVQIEDVKEEDPDPLDTGDIVNTENMA